MRYVLIATVVLASASALAGETVQVFDWAKAPAGTVVAGPTTTAAAVAAAQAPVVTDLTGPCPETE
ncbi:MAG: hypothetical protein U1E56_09300 [Bauldia sp.]